MTGRRQAEDAYQIHVIGPDCAVPPFLDFQDLVAAKGLSRAQLERLDCSAKVVATQGTRVVGLACFDRQDDQIRVHELLTDPAAHARAVVIMKRLLDALELACLASGGRRVVLLPEAILMASSLEDLGYREVCVRPAGPWLEKHLG